MTPWEGVISGAMVGICLDWLPLSGAVAAQDAAQIASGA
jgi:hypothetical protein